MISVTVLAALLSQQGGALPAIQVHSAPGASAAAIQAAVDACPATGCRIELPDSIYVLEGQVWIKGRDRVEVQGTFPRGRTTVAWDSALVRKVANPLSGKNLALTVAGVFALRPPSGGGRPALPAGWLMWPHIGAADDAKPANGPLGSIKDTSSPFSASGFQRNGMFLVENSSGVSFRGLVLDGIRPAYFVNKEIWGSRYDVLFGTVAVDFLRSFMGTVSDCEIRNFWTAVYLNDGNAACLYRPGESDAVVDSSRRLTACGTVGAHLVERSEIHGNVWAAYSENAWDMGSVFRANLAWDDRNQKAAHPGDASYDFGTSAMINPGEMDGGFLFEKDVVYPAHVVDHNTLRGVNYPYSWGGYRVGGHALWTDNLLDTVPGSLATTSNSWQQFGRVQGKQGHLRRNTFLQSMFDSSSVANSSIVDSLFPYAMRRDSDTVTGKVDTTWLTTRSSIWAKIVQPFRVLGHLVAQYGMVAAQGDTMRFLARDAKGADHWEWSWNANAYDTVGLLGPNSYARVGSADMDASWWRNFYCLQCRFETGAGAKALRPTLSDPITARATRSPMGVRGALDDAAVPGSFLPVSVRASTGAWRDDAAARLHLPLVLDAGGRTVDRWIALDGQKSSLSIAEPSGQLSTESVSTFGASDLISPDGSEAVLPSPASDALVQVDLWVAAISGADTLPAGAVSWVWVQGMKRPATTFATGRPVRERDPIRVGVDSRGPWALVSGPVDGFRLVSPSGRTLDPVSREAAGGAVRLRFPRVGGVWFVRGPGAVSGAVAEP